MQFQKNHCCCKKPFGSRFRLSSSKIDFCVLGLKNKWPGESQTTKNIDNAARIIKLNSSQAENLLIFITKQKLGSQIQPLDFNS